jgi:hypothetical protein
MATVLVRIAEPLYGLTIVVNCWGSSTSTVPVCPGRLGVAIVAVTAEDPVYSDVSVVKTSGT